ncbi:MAG: helix-turn-helix transcriptional regulator [Clostridium sp.]|nr:helix-turn-helix transcriptional regulator [Clostridium sp.]MBS5987961.1 helix-turn-helix transcriptional regulator [Clostridium sp.]
MMNLKVARVIKGFTQERLAEKSGVCRTIISRLEQNKGENIKNDTKNKIADALNFTVDELFGKDGEVES